MKAAKWITLEVLLLIVLLLCATGTMKILDMVFTIGYENIWMIGCRVGFLAWIILLVGTLVHKLRKR